MFKLEEYFLQCFCILFEMRNFGQNKNVGSNLYMSLFCREKPCCFNAMHFGFYFEQSFQRYSAAWFVAYV